MSAFHSAASDIDRAMLNILEENAQLLNQIEANILTSQVGFFFFMYVGVILLFPLDFLCTGALIVQE